MITCRNCKTEKDEAGFYPYMVHRNGKTGLCKLCHGRSMAEHRAKNPEQTKNFAKKHAAATWQKTKARRDYMLAAREVQS
jgi:hypothetical protein